VFCIDYRIHNSVPRLIQETNCIADDAVIIPFEAVWVSHGFLYCQFPASNAVE
jgi:hypothetical protein